MVAVAGWEQSARDRDDGIYLCHLLCFPDFAAAEEAEKVAGHAERIEEWGQDRNQRRAARNDHQPQGGCGDLARASGQFEARSQPGIGGVGDYGRGRKVVGGR